MGPPGLSRTGEQEPPVTIHRQANQLSAASEPDLVRSYILIRIPRIWRQRDGGSAARLPRRCQRLRAPRSTDPLPAQPSS